MPETNYLLCPHAENCNIYREWNKQIETPKTTPDVIANTMVSGMDYYVCSAQSDLAINKDLREKLNTEGIIGCSHLNTLHKLALLTSKLSE